MSLYTPRARVFVTALFNRLADVELAVFEIDAPQRIEWTRTAARKADKCTIELAYRDFPIDPRLLSAIHVGVYVGDVDPVPASPRYLRFIGNVDVPEVLLNNADARIRMECRDYTGLALDRNWRRVADEAPRDEEESKKSRIRIPAGMTLGAFVAQWRRRMRPQGATATSEPETVFDEPSFAALRLDKAASGSLLAMGPSDTAWDALALVCEWYGLVPMWDIDPTRGAVLRIRAASAEGSRTVSLDYGRDLVELNLKRNLQAPERKQVRIAAWNPRLGKVLASEFPASPVETRTLSTEGAAESTIAKSQLRRVQYNLYGDYDLRSVQEIAQRVYQDQGRRRLTGAVRTMEMRDADGNDVLALSNGDTLVTSLSPTTIHGIDHLSTGAAIRYLSDPARPNSLPPLAARAVADGLARMRNLSTEFYVEQVTHVWDHDEGYNAEIRFSDFITGT